MQNVHKVILNGNNPNYLTIELIDIIKLLNSHNIRFDEWNIKWLNATAKKGNDFFSEVNIITFEEYVNNSNGGVQVFESDFNRLVVSLESVNEIVVVAHNTQEKFSAQFELVDSSFWEIQSDNKFLINLLINTFK